MAFMYQVSTLQALANAPRIESAKGRYALHQFPSSYPFAASTADLPSAVARRAAAGPENSREGVGQ